MADIRASLTAIRAGDLYALLEVCSDTDLEPLVTCITSKVTNFLTGDNLYKTYYPRHSLYARAIGDDLRLFGGNTLRNASRGAGPSYDEIVLDVSKWMKVPYQKGNTAYNESQLLDLYSEGRWSMLDATGREETISKARRDLGAKAKSTGRLGKFSYMLAPLIPLAPVAAFPLSIAAIPLLGSKIAGPSYDVTVPCVLHIAYLRRRYLEPIDRAALQARARSSSPPKAPAGTTAGMLIIGVSEREPLLSLREVPKPEIDGWRDVVSDEAGISRLNPLLQAVPALATVTEVLGATGTRYMEVVANGNLVGAKDVIGAYRGFVVNSTGIESHALLLDPSKLASIVTPAAVWQVASVIVAQKHLADISAKLTTISNSVKAISEHLTDGRRSVILGAIRYMEQMAPAVFAGELDDSIIQQIESEEVALLKVQSHLKSDLDRTISRIAEIQDTDTFGSKGLFDEITNHQHILTDLFEDLLLCLRTRACGLQLLCAFPGNDLRKENRRRHILNDLSELDASGNNLRTADLLMRKRIDSLSSIFDIGSTVNERKLQLLKWSPALHEKVRVGSANLERELTISPPTPGQVDGPATFLVKIEDGCIVSTHVV